MSSSPTLPPLNSLPSLHKSAHAAMLGLLFEPSDPLINVLYPVTSRRTPYPDYTAMVEAARANLLALAAQAETQDKEREALEKIATSHPRLGEQKVESELSRLEQSRMNAAGGQDGEDVAAELARLNEEYESVFPGLRFTTFVNGRPRMVIMEEMKARMKRGDILQERRDTINAMCDIAEDRAKKLEVLPTENPLP